VDFARRPEKGNRGSERNEAAEVRLSSLRASAAVAMDEGLGAAAVAGEP
jgi:hypothetical protein